MVSTLPKTEPTASVEGVVTRLSPFSVGETLKRLRENFHRHKLTIFAQIDHSDEARKARLEMQEAHLLIFGNPVAGTPVMIASPLLALDLPLKALVWQSEDGRVWVSSTPSSYLKERFAIPETLISNIAGADELIEQTLYFREFNVVDLKELRSRLEGEAFLPGDAQYEQACLSWDSLFRQQPAIVVLPTTPADVVVAVRFARTYNLPIAVQAGGHGHPFEAEALKKERAMLINFARMKKITLDPASATARVESGVVWSEVISLASPYGLAPLNGFAAGVGVSGYLLGGGYGWLVRQYGLGANSIRSLEVVSAEGEVLQVDQHNHGDLFWGLRGGGGNFGVVTAIEFDLYPVKEIFGGQVIYPIEQSWKVFPAYLEWVKTLPPTLTSTFRVMQFPPLPEVPPALQGKTVAMVLGCYNGSEADGIRLFEPMRTLSTPLADTFARLPYSQIATISNDPDTIPPLKFYNYHSALRTFNPEQIKAFLEIVTDPASGLFEVELRHLAGGPAERPEDEMAISLADINFSLYALVAAPTEELLEAGKNSVAKMMQAIPSDASVPVLLNALAFNDIGPVRTRAGFTPSNYQRLVALKNIYDPSNIFRFNNNILPSS